MSETDSLPGLEVVQSDSDLPQLESSDADSVGETTTRVSRALPLSNTGLRRASNSAAIGTHDPQPRTGPTATHRSAGAPHNGTARAGPSTFASGSVARQGRTGAAPASRGPLPQRDCPIWRVPGGEDDTAGPDPDSLPEPSLTRMGRPPWSLPGGTPMPEMGMPTGGVAVQLPRPLADALGGVLNFNPGSGVNMSIQMVGMGPGGLPFPLGGNGVGGGSTGGVENMAEQPLFMQPPQRGPGGFMQAVPPIMNMLGQQQVNASGQHAPAGSGGGLAALQPQQQANFQWHHLSQMFEQMLTQVQRQGERHGEQQQQPQDAPQRLQELRFHFQEQNQAQREQQQNLRTLQEARQEVDHMRSEREQQQQQQQQRSQGRGRRTVPTTAAAPVPTSATAADAGHRGGVGTAASRAAAARPPPHIEARWLPRSFDPFVNGTIWEASDDEGDGHTVQQPNAATQTARGPGLASADPPVAAATAAAHAGVGAGAGAAAPAASAAAPSSGDPAGMPPLQANPGGDGSDAGEELPPLLSDSGSDQPSLCTGSVSDDDDLPGLLDSDEADTGSASDDDDDLPGLLQTESEDEEDEEDEDELYTSEDWMGGGSDGGYADEEDEEDEEEDEWEEDNGDENAEGASAAAATAAADSASGTQQADVPARFDAPRFDAVLRQLLTAMGSEHAQQGQISMRPVPGGMLIRLDGSVQTAPGTTPAAVAPVGGAAEAGTLQAAAAGSPGAAARAAGQRVHLTARRSGRAAAAAAAGPAAPLPASVFAGAGAGLGAAEDSESDPPALGSDSDGSLPSLATDDFEGGQLEDESNGDGGASGNERACKRRRPGARSGSGDGGKHEASEGGGATSSSGSSGWETAASGDEAALQQAAAQAAPRASAPLLPARQGGPTCDDDDEDDDEGEPPPPLPHLPSTSGQHQQRYQPYSRPRSNAVLRQGFLLPPGARDLRSPGNSSGGGGNGSGGGNSGGGSSGTGAPGGAWGQSPTLSTSAGTSIPTGPAAVVVSAPSVPPPLASKQPMLAAALSPAPAAQKPGAPPAAPKGLPALPPAKAPTVRELRQRRHARVRELLRDGAYMKGLMEKMEGVDPSSTCVWRVSMLLAGPEPAPVGSGGGA